MGSYNSWRLTIADRVPDLEKRIVDAGNALPAFRDDKNFASWFWFRFSESTKWWATESVVALSKQFPEVVFRLDCSGDANFAVFFLNGEGIYENEIWPGPRIPARNLFKKSLKSAKAARAETERRRKEAAAKAESERLQRELDALKAKQQEIERKLGSNGAAA